MTRALRRGFAALLLIASGISAQTRLEQRIGFYQWVGSPSFEANEDLLTRARRRSVETGSRVFRLYLGARFDYLHPPLSPRRFSRDRVDGPLTPAKILALPRYRSVLEDDDIETVVLTVYPIRDYGAGPDDINLLRPWSEAEAEIENSQTKDLCEFLYQQFGDMPKTVILANSEADAKLLEIMNYTGSAEQAIDTLTHWTNTRFQALDEVRRGYPKARLRIFHALEINVVNLRLVKRGARFHKAVLTQGASEQGWSTLEDVVPHVVFDLLSYSAYESANSPFETWESDVAPQETVTRLRRDLERIRTRSEKSLSPAGRRRFGKNFVMIGELGYARDRFEHLPTGPLLPRLYYALKTALEWGCPYVVLWQVCDSPRDAGEPWGFGMYDKRDDTPRLKAVPEGCDSVKSCLSLLFSDGFDAWRDTNQFE